MANDRRFGKWHARDAVTSRLRLRGHDYSAASTYFVTIVTGHRACLFGEIADGLMVMNEAGIVVESWCHSIPSRFPDTILDAMIVMPNHLHGIISVGTHPATHGAGPGLSDIVGWFKTRTVNDYGLGGRVEGWPPYRQRLWQPGYHEHILRTDAALDRVRAYIAGNPARWDEDAENPQTQTNH